MTPEQIKSLIETNFPNSKAEVTGDGHHFEAIVISAEFEGKKSLERQRRVYQAVGDNIANGSIHALSIKTYTEAEWHSSQST